MKLQSCEAVVYEHNSYQKIISRIEELARYQKGWYDGKDGLPAEPKVIEDVKIFIKNLDLNNIYLPYISLAKDGEVNLWWDVEKIKLDLGFYGDGTYSYYGKLENGKEFFEDEANSCLSLPIEILERLKK